MTAWRSIALLLAALAVVPAPALAQDDDRDGLPDALEQALLERFLPTFVLSADECDGLPAAMIPGISEPRVAARNGTIYGYATPRSSGTEGVDVEIKYFHLWARDCGRPSHALDAEHLSALIHAPATDAPIGAWRAEDRYAAAHEGTLCDASSGARAEAIRAAASGPYVYISRGKHASYLVRGQCKWGCGSDLRRFSGRSAPALSAGQPGRTARAIERCDVDSIQALGPCRSTPDRFRSRAPRPAGPRAVSDGTGTHDWPSPVPGAYTRRRHGPGRPGHHGGCRHDCGDRRGRGRVRCRGVHGTRGRRRPHQDLKGLAGFFRRE